LQLNTKKLFELAEGLGVSISELMEFNMIEKKNKGVN